MIALASYAKQERKRLNHCQLCGKAFHSNRRLNCSYEHSRDLESLRNGRLNTIKFIANLLNERGELGAMLEDKHADRLQDWNWIESVGNGRYILSKWGKQALERLDDK